MSTRRIECPKCGHGFPVRIRAQVGHGTQRKVELNENRRAILAILEAAGKRLTVRQVQRALYAQSVRRWQRGDTKEATGQWNYHQVQADLSLLVGNGHAEMSSASEFFDLDGYGTRPVPLYWVKREVT